ncbi:aldo/keto reductase [uncultured Jannaschia sp.]|uniref:aldo/keto reductase n=1 Tax=uncultured Jannaschia sp. TaxID=293347 RepID=UPI00261B9388|nr:aldo/keto reductase [uncultured Jannaschia sp.]
MRVDETELLNDRSTWPVRLTRMGFGAAPLGNLYRAVSDADAQDALDAAWEAGIRYFDTAPQYGLGRSEMRVAEALSRFGREGLTLSTKVGRLLEDCAPGEVTPEAFVDVPQKRIVFDYTHDGVMRSYEASVKRLGTERFDILYVHDIDAGTHGAAESEAKLRELFAGGGYAALDELRRNGSVGAIGAGVNTWPICERLLGEADFDGFLLAGRYTLLEQEPLESLLPLCVARDVGIVLGGPYNSGILATGAVEGARYDYAPAPPEILDRVRRLEEVCAAHDTSLIAAALQFPLAHPAVKSVIPGAANAAEVAANVDVFETGVPDALWSDLRGEGLIRRDAPVPGEVSHAA